MNDVIPWAILSGVSLVLMLVAEWTESRLGKGTFKFFASIGFLGAAVSLGAADSSYGYTILSALILSFFGDMFLLSRQPRLFQAGLFSFLVAHVGYCVAFVVFKHADWVAAAVVFGVLCVLGAVVLRWLLPEVSKAMRIPVVGYMLLLTAMVAFAAGASWSGGNYIVVAGACLFYLSDLFVARDRFVKQTYANQLLGLPMYYAAQFMLAYSVVHAE